MDDARGDQQSLAGVLAQTIAALRAANHWTLEDLADRAEMHRTTIGLVERGQRGLTISAAEALAQAFQMPLSGLLALAEAEQRGVSAAPSFGPRRIQGSASLRNDQYLQTLCGLQSAWIREAVEYVYDTLDIIDSELRQRGSEPIARLVELANLSSMIGNLLGAGIAKVCNEKYVRNRPHAFPDLVPQEAGLPDLEVKTALETNMPKGHLPKAGTYLTFRYVLAAQDGSFTRGKNNRGSTAWIWEVRAGKLDSDDFSCSNTDGDSGKTATIRSQSLKSMKIIMLDARFRPYARPWGET